MKKNKNYTKTGNNNIGTIKRERRRLNALKTIIKVLLFFVLLVGLIYSLLMSFSITKKEVIDVKETGDIDYSVYLKDNNFYDTSYLKKGMAYVASLIDKINITFNYKLDISKKSNIDLRYQAKAKLIIESQTNSNIFYESEYDLSKEVIDEMVDKDKYEIVRNVDIDYDYYNSLANQFRSNYSVNTNSYLEVYLQVSENNKKSNSYELNNNNQLTIRIPLSQQEVNITLDDKDINSSKQIVNDSKFIIKDVSYLILAILIALLMIITFGSMIVYYYPRGKKRTKYDKFIGRILYGYDRVIVNVETSPNKRDYNVIVVGNFQELLDVRDNTKEPINYYVVSEGKHSEFYVINGKNMYLYTVKLEDLDGNVENEEK